jgi:hypothetical protein
MHPAFDYLLVSGALSFVLVDLFVLAGPLGVTASHLAGVVLFANSAHFAASTVRLYTKPDATATFPLLTLGFPLVALAVATGAIAMGEPLGRYLVALYIFWSPYHYAAQTYGLAAMYAYRSGVALGSGPRRWLRWGCLTVFLWTLLQPDGGLGFVVPAARLTEATVLNRAREGLSTLLWLASLTAPIVTFAWLRLRHRTTLPLMCPLLMVTNVGWFVMFPFLKAFFWATVFHAVQYLTVVMIFHVRDRTAAPGNRHGPLWHAMAFYGACLLLGYTLFELWPRAYALAGFDPLRSVTLVTAVINIHHFVVDAFIWRLRRSPAAALALAPPVPLAGVQTMPLLASAASSSPVSPSRPQ